VRDLCAAARDVTLLNTPSPASWTSAAGPLCSAFVAGGGAGPVPRASGLDVSSLTQVLDDRTPLRLRRRRSSPGVAADPGAAHAIRSYLAVPIAASDRVYGWIGLVNKLGAAAFSERDEQVAMMVGLQAGSSLKKLHLLEDLRRQSALLQASEERTHYALSAARMGIWELDLRTERVTWSTAIAEMFG
jgi:GAF domain-containing protein